MAMFDINGEEFLVGDTLKVIKEDLGFKVGDLVVCSHDDGSECCRFNEVGGLPQGVGGLACGCQTINSRSYNRGGAGVIGPSP